MTLSEKLSLEITSYHQLEPNVPIFIDEAGNLFWVSKDNYYVWLQQEKAFEDYIDEDHKPEYKQRPEGVMNTGVYWMNQDFNSPFHISEFQAQIKTITI